MKPTGKEARNILRAFIRARDSEAKVLLDGRAINDLTMSDLGRIAAALNDGLNPLDHADDYSTGTTQEAEDESDSPDTDHPSTDKQTDKQLAGIRDLIVNGGFTAADATLRKLIADANKPAEVIEVPTTSTSASGPVTHAKPTNVDKTWSSLFSVRGDSVRGDMGKRTSRLWDGAHPNTPAKDDLYVWAHPVTSLILTQLARGKNVFLWGPPSTGKTSWAEQLAAALGRPFALIACDDQTDAPTLLGMTVPKDGGTIWQDGILTQAIQTPGCVICIDEPSLARAGALMVMQNVLAHRVLWIAETGRRVPVAKGVIFIACDNTNGTGGGARHGFTGTGRLNAAFLDRFGVFPYFDYLPPDKEALVIIAKVNCTRALADLLVSAATTTRQAAKSGTLSNGLSLRRLLAWAEALTDGNAPQAAFETAILNAAPEADREALTQQCLLTYDKATVEKALNGHDTNTQGTVTL